MLSITLLSTPAWADRFAAMNLLHDTQEEEPVESIRECDPVLLVRSEPTDIAA
jgi:hypothetical protein